MVQSASDGIAFDRASARSFDAFGRLHVAGCRFSKANTRPYFGREIPNARALGLDPNRVYKLYCPPDELAKGADTFRNSQVMLVHAKVNAASPKNEITVGTVGNVAFDGTYLVADQLTVWDRDGITLIETEQARELSPGYGYRVEMTPGTDPEGVAYDGVMRDIKGNHVALVRKGRTGSDVIVNDAHPSEPLAMFKRPNLFAVLVSLGLVAKPADEAAHIALDAQLASMSSKDLSDDDMEDDPENPGKRRLRAAGKAGTPRDGSAKSGFASDTDLGIAVDAAIKARGFISKDEAQAMANDAAVRASQAAVASVNALHEARELVKPLVGVVAMDSAEGVYRFALEKEGVALDGIHASALPALVRERIARKTDTTRPAPKADSANAVSAALPGLGRFSVG